MSEQEPKRYSLEYWAKEYGLGVRTLFRFISTGEIKAVKIGRRTVITPEAWGEFIKTRPNANIAV